MKGKVNPPPPKNGLINQGNKGNFCGGKSMKKKVNPPKILINQRNAIFCGEKSMKKKVKKKNQQQQSISGLSLYPTTGGMADGSEPS